jgi:hypothetical protein
MANSSRPTAEMPLKNENKAVETSSTALFLID